MPNEYGSRPCCRLINTALAQGARPARLRRTAAAHRVPARHRSRTQLCGGVLWARWRQLAPRRNKAAALCRPNASLCCHLRSLLVLIDMIGATLSPKTSSPLLTLHTLSPVTEASNRWRISHLDTIFSVVYGSFCDKTLTSCLKPCRQNSGLNLTHHLPLNNKTEAVQ